MGDNEEIAYPTDKRGFHIAHLNLQSINNKFDLVKIQVKQMKFHVFTFSESWLHQHIPDNMINIEGYNLIRLDRQWSEDGKQVKKGGGVGFYVREDLTYSTEELKTYNCSTNDIECFWIQLMMKNSKNIIIGVLYRPPSGNVETCFEKLATSMEAIGNSYNKEVFILGDFNINYLKKNDHNTKQLLHFETMTGLKQLMNEPTRGTNCIDLIFTNSCDASSFGSLNVSLSDHELIYVSKKKVTVARKYVDFWGRSYRNYDRERFQNAIRGYNWDQFWNLEDPNHCWEFITQAIEHIINPMCPLKKHRVRNSNEPWLSNGILEAIFDKDQAWKLAKRTKNADDIIRAKRLRNEVKDMIRRAKKDFIQEELDNNNVTAKKFWERSTPCCPLERRAIQSGLLTKAGGR